MARSKTNFRSLLEASPRLKICIHLSYYNNAGTFNGFGFRAALVCVSMVVESVVSA